MDTGCYAIHMLRFLSGAEPEVTAARAKLLRPGVDRWMQADMSFDDGRTGRITCALLSARLLKVGVRVTGDEGVMTVLNPTAPQFYHRLRVKAGGGAGPSGSRATPPTLTSSEHSLAPCSTTSRRSRHPRMPCST